MTLERGWLGAGYGHSTPGGAIAPSSCFGAREGVILEPVYTAKAVAALLELNRRGAFGRGRCSTGTPTAGRRTPDSL